MNKFTVKEPQVADLVKEAEKKIEEAANKGSDNELKETLAELKQEMKLYNDQIGAYNNSKMEYQANERNDKKYSDEDLAKAYLYAKTKGVPIHQTAIGETMMKAITSEAAFETGFTNTVQSELELNLKIAPLFRQIAVNQKTLQYPVKDAGSNRATVFPSGKYAVHPDETTNVATAYQTTVSSVELAPHKFMSRTFLTKDEEEDTVLALMPILRADAVKVIAKDMDRALLRGDGSLTTFTAAPTGYQSPFKGVATLADDVAGGGLEHNIGSNTATANVSSIASARSILGKYGVQDTLELVYVTSVEGYNVLVQDTNFMTVDKIGNKATLLTGQVGAIWGIPVIISEFMDNTGIDKTIGCLIYVPGYVVGRARGVEVETNYIPSLQMNELFISTKVDMKPLATVASGALSNTYSMACVVKSQAT